MATEQSWLININKLLENDFREEEQWQRCSIYKLPAYVRDVNKNAYTPQVVSFGPYHYGNENLRPMERHKDRALLHFLKRSGLRLEHCMHSLSEIASELMHAYDSLDADFLNDKYEFLRIMIRDGCFMVEMFSAMQERYSDYAENDPIFGKHGKLHVMRHIKRDMLILENQLPMMLLRRLYRLEHRSSSEPDTNIDKLAFRFFFPESLLKIPSDCMHVMDMYRKSIILPPKPHRPLRKTHYTRDQDSSMRSAVEIYEAGIKIRKSKTAYLNDIKFENGELRLPTITVDDLTEQVLLNLMAFESFHIGAGNEVTEYSCFMDNIINDSMDIRVLHFKDIIQNCIGNDREAAALFNSLSKGAILSGDLGEVYEMINEYCRTNFKSKYRRHLAALRRFYFSSPWTFISLFAAICFFVLTITQTLYTILPYYNPRG